MTEPKPGMLSPWLTTHHSDGTQTREPMPRTPDGFTDDKICRSDEIDLLKRCQDLADGKPWVGGFSYPGCQSVVYNRGWAHDDGKITEAGKAALKTALEAEPTEAIPT